jgi:hypothetical protein
MMALPVALAAAVAGLLIGAAVALDAAGGLAAGLERTLPAGAVPAIAVLGAIAAGCGALLPTAPAYLLIAAVLVPVLIDLSVRAGAALPLAGAHLALLYAAVAGAALPGGALARMLGRGRPGDRRAALRLLAPLIAIACALPFNGTLLALGQPAWIEPLWALFGAAVGMAALAGLVSADRRHGRARWEIGLLGAVAVAALAPRLWLDAFWPDTAPVDARRLVAVAGASPPDAGVPLVLAGGTDAGDRRRGVIVPLGAPGGGAERLASAGIELRQEGELVKVARVIPASWADRTGVARGALIVMVRTPVAQPSLGFVVVPAAALGLWLARRRAARLKEMINA